MALFKNRLLSGALFAGALFAGQTDEVDQAQGSGRAQPLRPHYENTQTQTDAPLSPRLQASRDNQPVSPATSAGLVEPGGFPASVDVPASLFDVLLRGPDSSPASPREIFTEPQFTRPTTVTGLIVDESLTISPPLIAGLTDDEAALLVIILAAEL